MRGNRDGGELVVCVSSSYFIPNSLQRLLREEESDSLAEEKEAAMKC